MTGVETNICVLSNTIEIQSAFPEADFLINQQLVSGRNHESSGLKILQDFNVEVVDRTDKKKRQPQAFLFSYYAVILAVSRCGHHLLSDMQDRQRCLRSHLLLHHNHNE